MNINGRNAPIILIVFYSLGGRGRIFIPFFLTVYSLRHILTESFIFPFKIEWRLNGLSEKEGNKKSPQPL
jgi:hypothetical protein